MKKLLIVTCFFCATFFAVGQGKFFKIYDDAGYDYGQGIIQLEDSSYMITGSSSSFADAPAQAFLMKIGKNGVHQWAKEYGFSEGDGGKRVLSAYNDSIFFILGYTQSTSGNGFDVLLIKTDSNGVELDKKVFGSSAWERINDAVIIGDSAIYAVGESTNTNNLNSNCFLMKFNMNGDTLWTKNWGSSGDDNLMAINSFDATTFVAVGKYYNADSLKTKCYVTKFDFNGNLIWEKQYGANGDYWLNDFYFYNGGIYAAGGQWNTTFLDNDNFFLRINDDGTPNLADYESPAEGESEGLSAVLYANNSKSYVVTRFKNQFSAGNSFDVLFCRFENNLEFEWSTNPLPLVTINFPIDDEFGEIIKTKDGAWVAVGSTPSETNGGMSVYVLKASLNDNLPTVDYSSIQSLVEVVTIDHNQVKLFPNPATNNLTIENAEGMLIKINDLQGKILLIEEIQGDKLIDLSNWESGIYLVNIVSPSGEKSTVRIIKN